MTAEMIARALGAARCTSTGWWNTDCPVCRSAGKLGVKNADSKLVLHCHKGCSYADIMAEIEPLNLGEDPVAIDAEQTKLERKSEAAARRRKIALARDVWRQAIPASGTLAEKYLRGRSIRLPLPASLGFIGLHSSYSWHPPSGEHRPQLVALIEHVEHGPIGISRTFLAIDGSQKASLDHPRIFTGIVTGGAVQLGPLRPDQWVVVSEGIETALSAMQLWDCGGGLAALSTSGLRNLILPAAVQMVWIAADNDESGVGQAAARDAAWMWQAEGRAVRVSLPPVLGWDFNDIVIAGF